MFFVLKKLIPCLDTKKINIDCDLKTIKMIGKKTQQEIVVWGRS